MHGNTIHRRIQAASSQSESEPSTPTTTSAKSIIPLPYQNTRNSMKFLIDNKNHLTGDQRLKAIILHKASLAYFCLMNQCEQEKNYGSCLRYLRLALNCYNAQLKLQSTSNESKKLLSHIIGLAGDIRLMISHVITNEDQDKFREQYQSQLNIDLEIENLVNEIGIDEQTTDFSWIYELTTSIERNLQASVNAYEYAINLIRNLNENTDERLNLLLKRLGNVRNEFGVYWMKHCAQALRSSNQDSNTIKEYFRKSFDNFELGIVNFDKIHDLTNVALLNSNLGRLMRYHAEFSQPNIDGQSQEFTQQERQSYQKSFEYYLRGLKLVENRTDLFEIYRTLSWELSNSYFAMAISLQDHAPLSTISQEDVSELI